MAGHGRAPERRGARDAGLAAAGYAVLALVLTWPLALGLSRDIPADMADPLLNTWIVAWGAEHLARLAGGDLAAFAGFWNAGIFHPAPLALTFSEHLFAQAVQAAPLYAATRDVILCYNLLFLSTFVLSGLGMFLLVRDVTRDRVAAFVAGTVFAFAPYRFEHAAHLQLLSLQWLPLALLGLRRFAASGRPLPLAAAALGLTAHNLSCGYYLLYFAPFVAGYAVLELAVAGRLADLRRWGGLAACAALTFALSLPFLLPYAEARRLEPTRRSALAVAQLSADLAAWVTATPASRLHAALLPGFDRAEGHLFPGFAGPSLALVALVAGVLARRQKATRTASTLRSAARVAFAVVAGAVAADHVPWPPAETRPLLQLPGFAITLAGVILFTLGAAVAALLVSPGARSLARHAAVSHSGFCAAAALLALWLSLGPDPRLWGLDTGLPGPYSLLYDHVPGFDGLRAPARYAAVVVTFLAILAGIGMARLRRLTPAPALAGVVVAAAMADAWCVPLTLNRSWDSAGLHTPAPPGRLPEPAVYAAVRTLPREAVLLELPLGEILWETRAMYYSTGHWRRLVNGYSGHFPRSYVDLRAALREALRDPDTAWRELRRSGATHVIVHRWAWYRGAIGDRLARGFEARGGRRLGEWDGDVLLELPAGSAPARPASLPAAVPPPEAR